MKITIYIQRMKMMSVKTAVVMEKMVTSRLKKAMENKQIALQAHFDALNAQKAARDALNVATENHHKAMFHLNFWFIDYW